MRSFLFCTDFPRPPFTCYAALLSASWACSSALNFPLIGPAFIACVGEPSALFQPRKFSWHRLIISRGRYRPSSFFVTRSDSAFCPPPASDNSQSITWSAPRNSSSLSAADPHLWVLPVSFRPPPTDVRFQWPERQPQNPDCFRDRPSNVSFLGGAE